MSLTTFSDARNYIRTYCENMFALNKMSESKQFKLEDAFIDTLYNKRYLEFANTAMVNRDIVSVNTVDGTSEYTIASNVLSVEAAFYCQGTDEWQLHPFNLKDRLYWEELQNCEPSGYSVNRYLDNTGKTIKLYPAPSHTGDIIKAYCVLQVTELTNDGDEPLIPQTFRSAICDAVIFDIQLMSGLLDTTKTSSTQLAQIFENWFLKKANECRKYIEFSSESENRVKNLFRDATGKYVTPCVNHSPVVTRISYLNSFIIDNATTNNSIFELASGDVIIYNDVTGAERLKVDASGLWINGVQYAFLGEHGSGTFAGNTGVTITLASARANTNYTVLITSEGDLADGSVGEINVPVSLKTTTNFVVKNTGSAGETFRYLVTV